MIQLSGRGSLRISPLWRDRSSDGAFLCATRCLCMGNVSTEIPWLSPCLGPRMVVTNIIRCPVPPSFALYRLSQLVWGSPTFLLPLGYPSLYPSRSFPIATPMPMSTITVLSSSSSSSRSSDGLPFQRNMSDFELEQKRKSHQTPQKVRRRTAPLDYPSETVYRTNVSRLVAAKSRPFTVSGRIPVDPVTLTLFFRSKVSILSMMKLR